MGNPPPETQLEGFLSKYSPEIAALAGDVLGPMRDRFPGAVQLVYDNYNALAIGFGPNDRASDAVFSIAVYPRWVSLFFLRGAALPDPQKLLKGSGKVVRHIVLAAASDLNKAGIRKLMDLAVRNSALPRAGGGMIIKSVSAKQRPRRRIGPHTSTA